MLKAKLAAGLLLSAGMTISANQAAASELSCGLNDGNKASGEPIVIGSIVSKTGPDDFSASAKAASAYFECVNNNGGINGRPIQYIVADDQWNPEIASQLAAKLITDKKAVAMVGNSSFVECAANAQFYKKNGIVAVAGVGVPRECFAASNYAPLNAGPRLSTIAAAEYASESFAAKSFVCIGPGIPNVGTWSCDGVKKWAESKGYESNTILIDPGSLDSVSVILQASSYSPDAVVLSLPKGLMIPIMTAAEEQGLDQRFKFVSAASGYDNSVPATLGEIWDGKLYVNMEFNALNSSDADNKNWLKVMDSYAAEDAPRDTFSQAGYLAARVITDAMLSIKDDDISRESVTKAVGNMQRFNSDILCKPWYYASELERQNANHTTRMAVARNGKWETVSTCKPSGDLELTDIIQYEKQREL